MVACVGHWPSSPHRHCNWPLRD